MSAGSDRLQDAPDAITYLSYVKAHLEADKATLYAFLAEVGTWVEEQSASDFSVSDASLLRIAAILRFHPKLLHGFNALLEPHGRLECSTMVKEVKFFVLVNSTSARIVSTSGVEVPFPSSDRDLRKIVISVADWKDLLNSEDDKDWLTCISQLLQVILDDPSTDAECNRRTYRCLRELARESILPPSIFIHSLKRGKSHPVQGGGFADIYKGDMRGTSVCFRVLRMYEPPSEDRDLLYKDFCSEVLVWRQLKHTNILPFIGANLELFSPNFCFISPWLHNGDIILYLKQHPDHDRFTSICEIVEGIEYLHGLNPPVTHKDIKGANVLVRDDLVCCLADFGLSTIVESQRLGRGSQAFEGSICWAAPEIMDPTLSVVKNAKASDIYALACTIYEIYTGRPPFLDNHRAAATIMLAVLRGERPSLPPPGNWTSEEDQLWWLVDLCWKHRPEDRPEMRLIKHTLRDIGMPDKKSLLAWAPSLVAEATASAADFREIQEWLEKEYHHATFSTSSPDLPLPVLVVQAPARPKGSLSVTSAKYRHESGNPLLIDQMGNFWLLGVKYPAFEPDSLPTFRQYGYPRTGENVPPGFYADFTSRIWLTCRSNFPIPIRDVSLANICRAEPVGSGQQSFGRSPCRGEKTRSSDSRWGSTIRTSQSLLANALLIVHLGRDWRCPPHQVQTADYAKYVEIITWFLDTLAPAAPFSVHRMTSTVKHLGWGVGQWLGYSAAFHAIKKLANVFPACGLGVSIATDSTLYEIEVYAASHKGGSSDSRSQQFPTAWGDRPVLLLLPIRLGIDEINPIYYDTINLLYTFPQSLGIAGGTRPGRSYYFCGSQDHDLFYLDPHITQPSILFRSPPQTDDSNKCANPSHSNSRIQPTSINHSSSEMGYRKKLKASSEDHGEAKNASELDPTQLHYCTAYPAEDLETFRCGSVKKMAMHILEPSILIGFLCRDEKDWGDFKKRVSDLPRSILSVNSRPPSIISDYEANMGFTSVSRQTATLGPELDDSDQLFVLRRAPTHLDDSQSANQISSGRPSHRVAGGSQKKPMKEEPDEMTPPQEEHTGAPQKTPSTLKIAHISTWASSPSDSDDSSPFSSSGLYSASPVLRSYTTRERTFDTNVNPVKFVIRKKMRARRKNHHVLSTSESSPKFDTDSPSLPSE